MRDKLKDLTEDDYWVYGVRADDLDYTIEIVQEIIARGEKALEAEIAEIHTRTDLDEQSAAEVHSDVAYYAWINHQYLWQFCIWRLQGIFESLIIHTYLSEKPSKILIGLKAKLVAAKESGYTLDPEDEEELLSWGKLRNSLSHAPPEQFRPAPINEEDVKEYVSLLKSVLLKWDLLKKPYNN